MKPKHSSLPWSDQSEHLAAPRGRPRLVFARQDSSGSDARRAEPTRVLIVEDDFLVGMEAESALRDAGFDVVGVAASAEEAVELAAAQRPALVIMDIRLVGERDGIDAALQLFREHGLRSLFATAHYDGRARKRAEPAHPLGWLQKPYTMASLVEKVRQAIQDLGGGKQ